MQAARQPTMLPPLQRLNEVERLVDNSLRGDWVVRIEHADEVAPARSDWRQWGRALFALRDAAPVTEAILACRADHPTHAIRLHAEKLRPESRCVFWVHSPADDLPAATALQPLPAVTGMRVANAIRELGQASRPSMRRVGALLVVLLLSALVFEQAVAAGVGERAGSTLQQIGG